MRNRKKDTYQSTTASRYNASQLQLFHSCASLLHESVKLAKHLEGGSITTELSCARNLAHDLEHVEAELLPKRNPIRICPHFSGHFLDRLNRHQCNVDIAGSLEVLQV